MGVFTTIIFDMYGVIIEESKGNFIPSWVRRQNEETDYP